MDNQNPIDRIDRLFAIAVTVMMLVAILSTATTIFVLYQAALDESKSRLHQTAHARALLLSSADHLFRLHEKEMRQAMDHDSPTRWSIGVTELIAALDAEIDQSDHEIHNHDVTFLAAQSQSEGDMKWLNTADQALVDLSRKPIQRALQGESGVDFFEQGDGQILAAYEPVLQSNIGLVVMVSLDSIQRDFIRAAIAALFIAFVLITVGIGLLRTRILPLTHQITENQLALENANHAKDDFFASVTHELRTPLTSIIGNSRLLRDEIDDPKYFPYIEAIEVAGQSQLALVNDVLDMSKAQMGKFTIEEQPFDLSDLISQIDKMFTVRAEEVGLVWKIKQYHREDHLILGDVNRISQILINLVGNAIKFTPKGEVSLTVNVTGEQLLFEVEDTGIGMSSEVLTRLFSKFEQADSATSRKFGGSGLGLYISLNLAELMGGSIDVSSFEGEGSKFQLVLPYRPTEIAVVDMEKDKLVQEEQEARFMGDVLIAEDAPLLQQLETRVLEKLGFTVTLVENGREAIERVEEQSFDMIFMDMLMPVMGGVEATAALRAQGVSTPIIALTANVMEKHRKQFEEVGCDGFLEKPIDETRLVEMLGQHFSPARKRKVEVVEQDEMVVKEASSMLADLPEETQKDLMQEFSMRLHDIEIEMKQALEAQLWDQVHDLAHVIKGSGAPYGYPQLAFSGPS